MPDFKISDLTAPISADAPCGPDLDLEGDPEFMNFMARAEGLLPTSFFSGPEGGPFDRGAIDFAAEFKTAGEFLPRTRDLRLLVLLAKYSALNRDMNDLLTFVGAILVLLETRWGEVHPREEDGEFAIRAAVIETLDDSIPIVLPLQYMPLVQSRRLGAISYRHFMIAAGEAKPREGEEGHDRPTIDKVMMEAELPTLIERRDQFASLQTALNGIAKGFNERGGAAQSISLEKSTAVSGKIFALLNAAIAKRDPAAAAVSPVSAPAEADAAPQPAPPGQVPTGAIQSNADVVAALVAVERYFSSVEPSSPALLLVRQAQQLIGKSFLEVMQILIPEQVAYAKFHLDPDQRYDIPLERLSAFAGLEAIPGAAASDPFAAVDAIANEIASYAADHADGSAGDVEDAAAEDGNSTTHDEDNAAKIDALPTEAAALAPGLTAETRQSAFALLEQIGAYYRVVEPSSPIAFITDRARGFAGRDFVTLLKDLLPGPSE